MKVQKISAGAVVVGAVLAGLMGAGSAQAAPGISIDPGTGGTNTIGIGDQSEKTGAYANATEGNTAFAISLFSPATATVGGHAAGSTSGAIGISSASGSSSAISGNVKGGGAYSLDGHTTITGNADGTQVYNVWNKDVTANGTAGASTTVAFCGNELTAKATNVTVSKACT